MNRLWMSGADGFVGQHVAREIAAGRYPDVTLLNGPTAFELRDAAAVDRTIAEVVAQGAHWIIHLAAMSFVPDSVRDPLACFDINLMGTLRLIDALQRHGFKGRFLLVSSADVYGATSDTPLPLAETTPPLPRNPYAASKHAAEIACQQRQRSSDIDLVIARPFNHVGSGQRADFVLPTVARQLALIAAGQQAPSIRLGDIAVSRDFTDVRDIVAAYIALLRYGRTGEVYNVCSGEERVVSDVVARLVALSGCAARVECEPARLRPGEQRRAVGSAAKIRRDTGWSPGYGWDETLTAILEDWKQRVQS
jgi:GDP-4-dehydro-6-deoxy-D-mannose reductase